MPSTTLPREVPCRGSGYEIGRAQGEALRAQIHGCYEVLRDLEPFRMRQPRWVPFGWFRRLAARRAKQALSPPVSTALPNLHDRTLGLAAGAAIPPGRLWLLQAMEAVLGSVKDNTSVPTPPLGGCTAVAVRGSRTVDGLPRLAHNFDYLPIVQPFFFVRRTEPTEGYRSLEFSVAPLAGLLDGINERGLAVSYDYAQTLDEGPPGPTISMLLSELLRHCASVTEALAWLAGRPRWGSGLLMLVDADGAMASVEVANTVMDHRGPPEGADLLTHTNKFHCVATQAVEVPRPAIYDDRAPRALRGTRVLESSEHRDRRLAELLASGEPFDDRTLAGLMADHGAEGRGDDNTICMHGVYWETSACLQLVPTERKLRIHFGPACSAQEQGFHEFIV